MSGWIKLEKSLKDDPRVIRLASRMRNAGVAVGDAAALLAVGALAHLWWYADTHIRADDTLDVGFAEIDTLLGLPGFAAMLPSDWLKEIDGNTVKLPGFQDHNGVEAKKRALTQKRMKRMRDAKGVTRASTTASPDQDQTKTYTKTRPKKKGDEQSAITYPIGLDAIAWARWLEYRTKTDKPIKPPSMQAAIDEFVKHGADQAAVVQQSIANSWQGLFPLKASGNGHNGAAGYKPSRPAAELIAEAEARGENVWALPGEPGYAGSAQ